MTAAGSKSVFRVHPAIGIARVGNSEEYYIAPETMAGIPATDPGAPTGGLPIRPGTESDPITSADLRDVYGAMKRQAARFRVFQYPAEGQDRYPTGTGREVQIGTDVDGKTVVDVIWTVHLANKKANGYHANTLLGVHVYEPANASELVARNLAEGADPSNPARIRRLVIDPGPRAIRGTDDGAVKFDKATHASFCAARGEIEEVVGYPKSFPDLSFASMYTPAGDIDTLGELRTEESGRLLVLPAHGVSCGWLQPDGTPFPFVGDVNADGWFDDAADGPVSAVLVFDDGSVEDVHAAWAVATDPSYAPQVRNVVTLWDDIFDTWVRCFELVPEIFQTRFQDSYRPSFEDDLYPLFRAVALQRWTTNLPERAITAHDAVGAIGPDDPPGETILTGLAFIRDPYGEKEQGLGAPFMPLSLGDSGYQFLSVTLTQYFLLQQWDRGRASPEPGRQLGPGEYLDKATLANCLGGRFAPGIEMTYVVRDPWFYEQDWKELGCGPFRVRARPLDYRQAEYNRPFLTIGYVPLHPGPDGITPARLEPGDACKFMAIPWQTDYNSCATHPLYPNVTNSTALYWSWPAQRPVAVHRAEDVHDGKLGPWRYSVRGSGTEADDLSDAGRYQDMLDSVLNWHRIGFVIQGSAIEADVPYGPDQYLEVASELDVPEIHPWPMNAGPTSPG